MTTVAQDVPQPPVHATRTARLGLLLIVAGLVLSLVFIVLLNLRILPTGVPGQWQWMWREDAPCPPSQLLISLMGLALVGILQRLLSRPAIGGRVAAGFVAACCLAAAGMMLVLESAEPLPPLHLAQSTVSVPATGYFSYATSLSGAARVFRELSATPETVPDMPCRVRTHPPGPVLIYYAGLRLLDAMPVLVAGVERWAKTRYGLTPDLFYEASRYYAMPCVRAHHFAPAVLLGLAVTLLGALLPIPAYFVGSVIADTRTGLTAALLAVLLPSLVAFVPSIDGVAAVLALAVLALGLWALRANSLRLYGLTGVALAVAMLWSSGSLAVAVPLLVAAIPHLRDPVTRVQALKGMAMALAAFLAVFLLQNVAFGYSPIANMRLTMWAQRGVMERANRDYWTWLPGNLHELLMFMGPGLLLAAVAGMFRRPMAHYSFGAFGTLLLVWLSGSTLGEVGRIWLFLMAMLVPCAALALVSLPTQQRRPLLLLLTLTQTALIILLHCRLALVQP